MAKTYVKKEHTYEDAKSTASTFLLVGSVGLIAIILIALGIIPLNMASYSKTLMTVVMGALFAIFLIVGIIYQRRLSSLKSEISEENDMTQEISDWFLANYTAESIDDKLIDRPEGDEALYFARYEIMSHALRAQYPQLESSYADYLIEEWYGKLF